MILRHWLGIPTKHISWVGNESSPILLLHQTGSLSLRVRIRAHSLYSVYSFVDKLHSFTYPFSLLDIYWHFGF